MQSKDRLRKKYFIIRKKKYFDIKPSFFYPLIELIKKKYMILLFILENIITKVIDSL